MRTVVAFSMGLLVAGTGLMCGMVTPARDFQLVGFSTETLIGGGAGSGLLAMNAACQADFEGSRICTRTEVVETTALPDGLTGVAWVRQAPSAGGDPLEIANGATCQNWTVGTGDTNGPTVVLASGTSVHPGLEPYSGFLGERCDSVLPVACCALRPRR